MAKLQDDSTFVRFLTPQYGIRALMKVLVNYEAEHGLNTISKIIHRWAPPSENNTDSYINDVSRRVGIPSNVLISISNKDVLMKVTKAIIYHENGPAPRTLPINWYDDETYNAAISMVIDE